MTIFRSRTINESGLDAMYDIGELSTTDESGLAAMSDERGPTTATDVWGSTIQGVTWATNDYIPSISVRNVNDDWINIDLEKLYKDNQDLKRKNQELESRLYDLEEKIRFLMEV